VSFPFKNRAQLSLVEVPSPGIRIAQFLSAALAKLISISIFKAFPRSTFRISPTGQGRVDDEQHPFGLGHSHWLA
jgi:hypothetical protein